MASEKRVYIVGAGVSGLVCAIELERKGYRPILLEATDRVGGRVKSDVVEGLPLDHGFQVMLTQYPATRRYLDYKQLELKHFLPGAVVFKNGSASKIGDPLRNASFLLSSLSSEIGSLLDKLKILKLSRELKSKSIDAIFSTPEQPTMDYLRNLGFSSKVIQNFFQPFFTGIFLEADLKTSSRMFEFVYKMFSEGFAAIPKAGIQAIPDQLKEKLTQSTLQFNCPVAAVREGCIELKDGRRIKADSIVVATDPAPLLKGYEAKVKNWHSCSTFYFKTNTSVLNAPIIGLIADKDALVNNLLFPTDLSLGNAAGTVLSATVVKPHQLSETALIDRVKDELDRYCGIKGLELLKVYYIQKALPALEGALQYSPSDEAIRYTDSIYLAGDHLANASLNAAMEAGRQVALAIATQAA
ncbi:MAG: NAD(P)/FAD-dependent oxidoreductase [Bacteroidota bacterium]